MSEYIKLEDALKEFNYGTDYPVNTIIDILYDLPTIEVSEEVLKATKKFNCYTIADENAEMGMRTQIEPIIEVSEDCIYTYCSRCGMRVVVNAPSATTEQSSMVGEWKRISPAYIYQCSVCGGNVMTQDIECYKYCHQCGAKMEGERNDRVNYI